MEMHGLCANLKSKNKWSSVGERFDRAGQGRAVSGSFAALRMTASTLKCKSKSKGYSGVAEEGLEAVVHVLPGCGSGRA